MLIFWLYKYQYLHQPLYELQYQFNLLHSKCLPYLPQNFVGREVEVRELMDLVDFSDSHNRVISIVGPPGFGKSTLAIHIGHNMVREGITVHYVDMMEVSSMQSLAEKVLDCDSNIVAIRNITVDRLFKWAREQYRTLLILDNSDDILHRQKKELQRIVKKLTQSSQNLKIIMTSRWKTFTQFNQFQYTLRELSTVASCSLLQNTVTGGINLTMCDVITNLTGNVPLALQVVGALLNIQDPAPDLNTVLESLERKLIPTLSSDRFPAEERVNASISLSYEYLTPWLQKIGRYLAHFPSSFDQEAACKILLRIVKKFLTCSDVVGFLDHLLERSLLEYHQRVHRYQFHRLIREFFLDIEKSNTRKNETRRFSVSFQSHFADRLWSLTDLFMTNHVKALAKLDTEQHNILYLVKCTATPDPLIMDSDYLYAVSSIHLALESGYLTSGVTAKELLVPVKGIVSYLDEKLEALLSKKQVPSTTYLYSRLYMYCTVHLAGLEEQVHGVSTAVETFLRRKRIIELIEVRVEGEKITSSYILFYRKLSDYYGKLEQHDDVKKCQNKILRKLNKELADCDRGTCEYLAIGLAYYAAADNENSAHFLQLALQLESENISTMRKANLMLRLHESYRYTHNSIEADRVLEELIALFPSIMDAPVSEIHGYRATVRDFIDLLKSNDKDEEATALEDKLIDVTLQIGATQSVVSTIQETKELAQHLYEWNKCIKAADLAVFALESFEHLAKDQHEGAQVLKFELQLLIGKAKIFAGNISEGLDYIELMVDSICEAEKYEHYLLTEACQYMIFRGRLWCLVERVSQDTSYVSGKMVSWIFGILEFNDYLAQPDSTQKIQAQTTQPSHLKELAMTTGQEMEIQLLLVISHLLFSLFSLLYYSVVMPVLVTAQWIISFKIVQFLGNVLFILLRQDLAYWIMRVIGRMVIQSAHNIWNSVVKFYIIILLVFCNIDIHVRDGVYLM